LGRKKLLEAAVMLRPGWQERDLTNWDEWAFPTGKKERWPGADSRPSWLLLRSFLQLHRMLGLSFANSKQALRCFMRFAASPKLELSSILAPDAVDPSAAVAD
jgi:hypothetical protein